MNWKLLLIGLSLVLGIFARPADEMPTPQARVEATTAAQLTVETTNLTEKSITEALKETTTIASKPKTDAPTTVRYLQQINLNQQTNSRSKYANNYANLITKHTINRQKFANNTKGNSKITVENLSFNVTSMVGGNNKINANEIAKPTIPSSSVNSNSSSRPLVFVDADITTTKRAFIALNGGVNKGTWSNYNLEESGTYPPMKKKPVIHKIISKWSDNPNDVFNLHEASNQEPFISSHQAQLTELSNQLVQSAFNNRIPTTSSSNALPLTIGQQLLHEHQHMSSTSTSTRKPVKKISSRKPIIVSSTVNNLLMNMKKPTKAPLKFKNNCLIKIGNKVISNYDECKRYQINNKIDSTKYHSSQEYGDDSPVGFQIETEPDFPTAPGSFPSSPGGGLPPGGSVPGGDVPSARPSTGSYPAQESSKGKHKKKNKKGGTDVGSMVITMMTMMAVFNPLNFGVWGIAFAPMAAMLLGGACFAMYNYMNYHPKPAVWHDPHHHHHHPWQKGQEIVIRNKIKHSPIPIKVTHLHKHATQPQPQHQQHHSHGPAVHEYSPPWESYDSIKSFGEPPSDYFPSAPSGGPYTRRKSNMRKRVQRPINNPFRFKLL